jgi:hypothetical protein
VSWGGYRLKVSRVYLGTCWGFHVNAFGQLLSTVEMVPCRQVQVVA